MSKSFQDGVDTLYNKCVNCGATPTAKSPTDIINAIQSIYNNRYSAGRTQGQNDVKNSPNSYGLYTQAQYNAGYNSGYNAGVVAGNCNISSFDVGLSLGRSHSASYGNQIIFVHAFATNYIACAAFYCNGLIQSMRTSIGLNSINTFVLTNIQEEDVLNYHVTVGYK